MHDPRKSHLLAIKQVVRNIKGTILQTNEKQEELIHLTQDESPIVI